MVQDDVAPPKSRWRRRLLVGLLILLASVVASAFAGWLLARAIPGDPPDNGKAREEVQRYYDGRWPNRFNVESCEYVEDAEAQSVYNLYDCNVSAACPKMLFSVPRADTFVRSDRDAVPPDPARPRC
jgi:hypothetical protein